MNKNVKRGIILVGLIVAAVVVYFVLSGNKKTKIEWQSVKVEKGEILNTVTATGTMEAIVQVEVGTQVSGIVNYIYVDYNSIVKKGELLAELDKTVLESELASQNADVANCKAEYEYQQKNYIRSHQLFQKGVISDTEYESASYLHDKAKSAYEKSKANLIKAKTNLGYAMIYSPIDGVVISRAVDEGQTVAASFNTPTLFTIANDLRKMQVVADVDEADIGQVKEGQRVSFTVDAYPTDVFEGDIIQVRLEPTTTSNVVTYEVIVNAPNPDFKLKPGLTANITIYTLEKRDILTVPAKALRFMPKLETASGDTPPTDMKFTPNDTLKLVWVKENDMISPREVVVGISNGISTEIKSGLSAGEEIVLEEKAGQPAQNTAAGSGESSPFMPKPPQSKNK